METTIPPALAHMDPQLRHSIDEQLRDITHQDFLPTDFNSVEFRPLVDTRTLIPENHPISETIENHLRNAVATLDESYLRLEQEKPGTTPSLEELVFDAQRLAITKAADAKSEKDQAKATEHLETCLVLDLLGDSDSIGVEKTPVIVKQALEAGLAVELVQAASNTRGTVRVQQTSFGSSARAAPEMLKSKIELLKAASGLDFDNQFGHVTFLPTDSPQGLSKRRVIAKLGSEDTATLAQLTEKQDTAQAADLAIMAVEKISQEAGYNEIGAKSVADTIIQSADIVKNAAIERKEPVEVRFQQALASVRDRRHAGSPSQGRANDSMTFILDGALVLLAQKGETDLAGQLMSVSACEFREDGHDNFRHPINLLLQATHGSHAENSEEQQRIRHILQGIHQQKVRQFKASLEASGAEPAEVEDIFHFSLRPESALAISAQVWDFFHQQSATTRNNIITANNDALGNFAVMASSLEKSGVEYNDSLVKALLKPFSAYNRPPSEAFFTSAIEMYTDMSSRKDRRMSYITFESVLKHWSDPNAVWQAAKKIYGDHIDSGIDRLCMQLRDETIAEHPDILDRLVAIHEKFANINPKDGLYKEVTPERMAALEATSADDLASVLQQTIRNDSKRGELGITVLDLIRDTDSPAELVSTLLSVSKDLFPAIHNKADVLGDNPDLIPLMLKFVVYSDEPEHRKEVLIEALQAGLVEQVQALDFSAIRSKELIISILESDNPQELIGNIPKTYEFFGDFTSLETLTVVSTIFNGSEIPRDLQELGITKSGEAGLNQLKTVMQKLTTSIFETGEVPVGLLARHSFLRNYFKTCVRFDISEWGGERDDETLLAILTGSERAQAKVSHHYSSQERRVSMLDSQAVESFQISEDCVAQYKGYVAVVNRALEIVPPSGTVDWNGLSTLLGDLQEAVNARGETMSGGIQKLQELIRQIRADNKDSTALATQLQKQQQQKDSLETINYAAVEDFDISKLCLQIRELAQHKSIVSTGLIQTLLVTTALLQMHSRGNNIPSSIQNLNPDDSPTIDDIKTMADFIGHTTNQETWRDLFSAVGGQKQLDELLGIDALNANIARGNSIGTSGTLLFKFMPTRGPLMELSGEIGDACWAGKFQGLIAENFPNMTAVIMVQNPDKSSRRMAGSAMLIETTSAQGEPLLVIRGLNPIQNTINQLSPASFFDEFTDYARGIAESMGRRLAIVIDDHSAGSSTNRPALFSHLEEIRPTLQPVKLMSAEDTTFNGYDITTDTYLVA